MTRSELLKIVENYCRKIDPEISPIKIVPIPGYISIFIEQDGDNSRSIMLDQQEVDGKAYWAGYSTYTDTIYISQAG